MKQTTKSKTGKPRGFAAMTPEKALAIQRKGGKTISKDRAYMSEIGKAGQKVFRRNYRVVRKRR